MRLIKLFVLMLIVSFSALGQTDPLKTYMSQFRTAEKNDDVMAAILAAIHRFLPDKTEHAIRLKDTLAQEFKKKFGVSVYEVNTKSCQENVDRPQISYIVDLATALSDQARILKSNNSAQAVYVARIACSVLYYASLKAPFVSDEDPVLVKANVLINSLKSEYPEVTVLDKELNSFKGPEQVLEKVIVILREAEQSCFAGICLANGKGIVSLFALLCAIPGLKALYSCFAPLVAQMFADKQQPVSDDDVQPDGGYDGGDDDDSNDGDGDDQGPFPRSPEGSGRGAEDESSSSSSSQQPLRRSGRIGSRPANVRSPTRRRNIDQAPDQDAHDIDGQDDDESSLRDSRLERTTPARPSFRSPTRRPVLSPTRDSYLTESFRGRLFGGGGSWVSGLLPEPQA